MKCMTGITCELLDTRPAEWIAALSSSSQTPSVVMAPKHWECVLPVFGTLKPEAETWRWPLFLAGAAGEQQSASRPMDCARRRNGAWGGALWGRCQRGVWRGELFACSHKKCILCATLSFCGSRYFQEMTIDCWKHNLVLISYSTCQSTVSLPQKTEKQAWKF